MNHRKFTRLSRSLDSKVLARGVLEIIWDRCYESGDDYLGTAADIDQLVGWQGAPGTLALALVSCGLPEGHGFIEPIAGGVNGQEVTYRVHDLWHHAPDYVANRRTREEERRIAKVCKRCGTTYHAADPRSEYCSGACRTGTWRARRSGKDRRVTDSDGGLRHGDGCVTDRDSTPAPAPAPAPAPSTLFSPEPHRDSGQVAATTPTYLDYPIVGADRATWALSEAQVAEWVRLFPGLDVRQELRHALAWVLAHPGRRKTARGMPKFLVGWLSRSQNRYGGRATGSGADQARPRAPWLCPHVDQCGHRAMCEVKLANPEKYPVRPKVAS